MKSITKSEAMVLRAAYTTKEDLGLRDIQEKANQIYGRGWKPQTVSTFLARLTKKGFFTMYRKGRIFYYTPNFSLDEIRKQSLQETAELFFDRDIKALKEFTNQIKV